MKISILTLFPEMFDGPFSHSIIKRAIENRLLSVELLNIRDFGLGAHKLVDDTPYGGGKGMVMRPDVLIEAIRAVRDQSLSKDQEQVILLDARGKQYKQSYAKSFSQLSHLILLCGHYEGVDERVRSYADLTISLGDFIVTGGETPAMVITDSVARLVAGVLSTETTERESFSEALLEYPQYTKPREYEGATVPDILLSGNHAEIANWRKEQSIKITKKHRPDLLNKS
jgi:tRNA (guanine37-N1)-methyltransferase